MNIEEFAPHTQRFIEAQMQSGLFDSVSKVIDALVEEKQAGSLSMKKQLTREEKIKLIEECEAFAAHSPSDPYAGLSHDEVLYDKLQQ